MYVCVWGESFSEGQGSGIWVSSISLMCRPLCGSSGSSRWEIWEGSLEEVTASKALQGKWNEK